MFKTKSLLTKATSPSCWSVVLPGQGNPAGIHEAAPPRTEPRSRAQQLQPPAHPCLPDPSPAADPGPARRRGPLCRPLPARLAGCRGDTPPPKKKTNQTTPKIAELAVQEGVARGTLLTFGSRHRGGEEEEEEERGPRQSRAVPCPPPAALAGGCGGLLVAEVSHAGGVPCACLPASRSSGHGPAPCPNFLNLPDTWTSISSPGGGRGGRPAHPARPARSPPPPRARPCPDRAAGHSAPGGRSPPWALLGRWAPLLGGEARGWAGSRALSKPPL